MVQYYMDNPALNKLALPQKPFPYPPCYLKQEEIILLYVILLFQNCDYIDNEEISNQLIRAFSSNCYLLQQESQLTYLNKKMNDSLQYRRLGSKWFLSILFSSFCSNYKISILLQYCWITGEDYRWIDTWYVLFVFINLWHWQWNKWMRSHFPFSTAYEYDIDARW